MLYRFLIFFIHVKYEEDPSMQKCFPVENLMLQSSLPTYSKNRAVFYNAEIKANQ